MLRASKMVAMLPRRFYGLASIAILVIGCGSAPKSRNPGQEFSRIAAILGQDDPAAGWKLLSKAEQQEISFEEFSKQWNENAKERATLGRAISEKQMSTDTKEQAVLYLRDGGSVQMLLENGQWKLKEELLTRRLAATPDAALHTLVNAVNKGSISQLVAILSSPRREDFAAKLAGMSHGLKSALDKSPSPIYMVSDERAELSWRHDSVLYHATLVLEKGEWRLDDLHVGVKADETKPAEIPTSVVLPKGPSRR